MAGREEFLREIYNCDKCPQTYGFSRLEAGAPYFKFPPTIGALGRADLLFVGINPRKSKTNENLHKAVMGDFRAFLKLARNHVGRDRYIRRGGEERHYHLHLEIVEKVFGREAQFEDRAAVTELFFCATADSRNLPKPEARCAGFYLQKVVDQVQPKALIAIGGRVMKYLEKQCLKTSEGRSIIPVYFLPHPRTSYDSPKRRALVEEVAAGLRHVCGVRHQL